MSADMEQQDLRIPHTGGGWPDPLDSYSSEDESSPHAWGCPTVCCDTDCPITIFPAYAGVNRDLHAV